MKNCLPAATGAEPARPYDRSPLGHAVAGQGYIFQLSKALGKIGEDLCCYFAAPSVWAENARDGHGWFVIACRTFFRYYSRVFSVYLFFSFIPAAPSSERIAFAVRPCRPITLPRSSGCTFN